MAIEVNRLYLMARAHGAELETNPLLFGYPSCKWMKSILANARIKIHIDGDSLIRDNLEGLRFRSNMPGRASLDIQNIIARQQCSMIVSIPVRSNPRDFFFSAFAQDNQGILGIILSRHGRRLSIGKLDLLRRNDR